MKLKFEEKIGKISQFAAIDRDEIAPGGSDVEYIGRTSAARNAEKSMGSNKVEVIYNGRRIFVEENHLEDED